MSEGTDVSTSALAERMDRMEQAVARIEAAVTRQSDGVDAERYRGALVLAERLSEPKTTAALEQLLERVDALESAVRSLASFVERAPIITDMVAQTAAELHRRAEARGIDVIARAEAGAALAEKATDPALMAVASRLMDRAEDAGALAEEALAPEAVALVRRLLASAGQVEGLVASATDPEVIAVAEQMIARTPKLAGVIEAASSDEAVALLEKALSRAGELGDLVDEATTSEAVSALERLVARAGGLTAAAETADTVYGKVAEGRDMGAVADKAAGAMGRLADATLAPEFDALLASGALDPSTLSLLARLSKAAAAAGKVQAPPMGAFALFRALSDPQVQKAAGFTFELAGQLGAALDAPMARR